MIYTDAIEVATLVASLCGLTFSVYSTWESFVTWRFVLRDVNKSDLNGVALRRLWFGASHTLKQLIMVISATVTMFMPIGESQSALRNFTLMVISLLLLLHSLYEHWERPNIDKWNGLERRQHSRAPGTTRRVQE